MTCHDDEAEARYAMERQHGTQEAVGLDIPDEARFTRFECFEVQRRRAEMRRWITLGLGALLAGAAAAVWVLHR